MANRNTYKSVSEFGSNSYSPVNNPLTYCMGQNMDQCFLHGGNARIYGQHSKPCQQYLSQYCADKWDGFCEFASQNISVMYPDQFSDSTNAGVVGCNGGTAGDALIFNTAARKYLSKMNGAHKKWEPFDPTVATSPMVSYWVSDYASSTQGIPEYSVNSKEIDNDPVMNKILAKPVIAMNILINIYNTMKRYNTISSLKGTRLGNFYNNHPYFKSKGGI